MARQRFWCDLKETAHLYTCLHAWHGHLPDRCQSKLFSPLGGLVCMCREATGQQFTLFTVSSWWLVNIVILFGLTYKHL